LTGRRGRRRNQLLDDLKKNLNFELKEEVTDRTLENSLWITCRKAQYITAMADNRSYTILMVSIEAKALLCVIVHSVVV
jgi:hypothetical protein